MKTIDDLRNVYGKSTTIAVLTGELLARFQPLFESYKPFIKVEVLEAISKIFYDAKLELEEVLKANELQDGRSNMVIYPKGFLSRVFALKRWSAGSW